jgi:hypothetical protein
MKGQCGIASRFSAEQIAKVREMEHQYKELIRRRKTLQDEFGMTRDEWSRYARGILGKKPARWAA